MVGLFFTALGAGLLNGLLGAGGGILVVSMLSKQGLAPKEAHATSLAVILPLTLLSLGVYALSGNLPLRGSLPFFIPALAGAAVGAALLPKVKPAWLKLGFSVLVLYSACRMLMR